MPSASNVISSGSFNRNSPYSIALQLENEVLISCDTSPPGKEIKVVMSIDGYRISIV